MYQQQHYAYDQEANSLVSKMHAALNKSRTFRKLTKTYRNKLGDVIAAEFLSKGGPALCLG